MAEREIPGVVMDHKREWRQQKRDLDEGTKRGRDIEKASEYIVYPEKRTRQSVDWPIYISTHLAHKVRPS